MKKLVLLGVMAAALPACAARPVVPVYEPYSMTGSGPDGWVDFIGFSFFGRIENGQPHGRGTCRDRETALQQSCDFDHGRRIDPAYLEVKRREQAAIIARLQDEANRQARERLLDQQRARERRAERHQSEALWGQTMSGFSRQVAAGAQAGYADGAAANARLEQARLADQAYAGQRRLETARQAKAQGQAQQASDSRPLSSATQMAYAPPRGSASDGVAGSASSPAAAANPSNNVQAALKSRTETYYLAVAFFFSDGRPFPKDRGYCWSNTFVVTRPDGADPAPYLQPYKDRFEAQFQRYMSQNPGLVKMGSVMTTGDYPDRPASQGLQEEIGLKKEVGQVICTLSL